MLIERRQWVIGILAAVLIAAGTAFAIVTTGSTLLVRGTRVTAEFTDASGLEAGDFVFVSGVRSGVVTGVERVPQSRDPDQADVGPVVEVELAVQTDAQIPADTNAEIFLYSTLGRRGVQLLPPDVSHEHLAQVGALQAGDHIPVGPRTSTLTDLPEFGDDTTMFLDELDVGALRELTTALADVTQGQRQDVDRLMDGVQRVSDVLVNRREQLARTLDRAEALIDVVESRDDQLLEVIDNFQVTLDTLLAKQDDIRRLLRETADTSTTAADLVEERRAQIDRVVRDLTEVLDVVDQHQVDLAHTLPYLSVGLEGFSSIGYFDLAKNDTGQWGNVFTTGLGQIGVEALLGCGSDVDGVLTDLFGPDPTCPEGDLEASAAGVTREASASDARADDRPGAVETVFGAWRGLLGPGVTP